ncbi:MAG TPA: DNA translocase FtsK 4TM domain-containing protein, partial [Methylocystis sp.]|nr:DNA translocase FtsK 4TM domain-containing protein [Methylocystis sp.]
MGQTMTRSQTLASDHIREFTRRRLAELLGLGVLACSAALALALFSWSARDPSLNHATDGRVHNFLGLPGAIVADLLMQLIGVGGAVAALPPLTALGLRLLTHRAGHRARLRALMWVGGVLCAATAASLLPVTDRWPLPTGLGGIVGDAVLALPRQLLGGNRMVVAAFGLAAIAGAILMLTGAAGYGFESEEDLRDEQRRLVRNDPAPARVESDDDRDDAGEPGYAIIALGAALHAALLAKALARRGFSAMFRRGRKPVAAEPEEPPVARREPVFAEADTFEAPAPRATRARMEDGEPPPRSRAEGAAPAPTKRVSRSSAPASQSNRVYEYPDLSLLAEPKKQAGQKVSQEVLEQNARVLEGVLD